MTTVNFNALFGASAATGAKATAKYASKAIESSPSIFKNLAKTVAKNPRMIRGFGLAGLALAAVAAFSSCSKDEIVVNNKQIVRTNYYITTKPQEKDDRYYEKEFDIPDDETVTSFKARDYWNSADIDANLINSESSRKKESWHEAVTKKPGDMMNGDTYLNKHVYREMQPVTANIDNVEYNDAEEMTIFESKLEEQVAGKSYKTQLPAENKSDRVETGKMLRINKGDQTELYVYSTKNKEWVRIGQIKKSNETFEGQSMKRWEVEIPAGFSQADIDKITNDNKEIMSLLYRVKLPVTTQKTDEVFK